MVSTKKGATDRQVTILVRFFIKKDHTDSQGRSFQAGSVILYVENDKGDRYYVTLRRNHKHSCSCPHVPTRKCQVCYHITYGRTVENARSSASKRKETEIELDKLVAEVEADIARELEQAAKRPVEKSEQARIAEYAPLNGNRAFSLMR